MKNKKGMSGWVWILIGVIVILIGLGIYFWFSGDGGSVIPASNSIPSPPALPD